MGIFQLPRLIALHKLEYKQSEWRSKLLMNLRHGGSSNRRTMWMYYVRLSDLFLSRAFRNWTRRRSGPCMWQTPFLIWRHWKRGCHGASSARSVFLWPDRSTKKAWNKIFLIIIIKKIQWTETLQLDLRHIKRLPYDILSVSTSASFLFAPNGFASTWTEAPEIRNQHNLNCIYNVCVSRI